MIHRWQCIALGLSSALFASAGDFEVSLRYRSAVDAAPPTAQRPTAPINAAHAMHRHVLTRKESWKPTETALIICDMWDKHSSINATRRGAEIAPRIDLLAKKIRAEGGIVIHAPSDCMKQYVDHPARRRAEKVVAAPRPPERIAEWCKQIPAEEAFLYPLDQSDGGSDDDPAERARWQMELVQAGRDPGAPWEDRSRANRHRF